MDVSTFYALFSASCFTLVGLWWGVVQRDLGWAGDPARRRAVAGVYLAFLLPALMGLFAQIGGVQTPAVWRVSFVVIALVGCLTTARLLSQEADRGVTSVRAGAVAVYAVIALLGVFPEIAGLLRLAGHSGRGPSLGPPGGPRSCARLAVPGAGRRAARLSVLGSRPDAEPYRAARSSSTATDALR